MLKLAHTLHELSFSALMGVYLEGNLLKTGGSYGPGLLEAEQEFYDYLRQVFFPTPGAVYAVWERGGNYTAALRLEPYRDGLLLEGLETAPELRRRGYANALVEAVLREFSGCRIYSHVAKSNVPSRNLHEKLGFRKVADHAVYINGSVNTRCVTYLWKNSTGRE